MGGRRIWLCFFPDWIFFPKCIIMGCLTSFSPALLLDRRQGEIWPGLEGEFWAHPHRPCCWSQSDWTGAKTGRQASHSLWPLLLEGLSRVPRPCIWAADSVSIRCLLFSRLAGRSSYCSRVPLKAVLAEVIPFSLFPTLQIISYID